MLKSTNITHSQNNNKTQNNHEHFNYEFIYEERIEEATQLYTHGFVEMNFMWKKLGANYNEVYSINRGRILNCSKSGWVCGLIDPKTDRIIAVTACQDLIDYVNLVTMPHNCEFVKILGKYAQKLEKEFFASLLPNLKRGDCSYNHFGVVKKEYAKTGVSKKFWCEELTYLKLSGYKYLYCRATSRYSTKLLTMYGGKIIKTVAIEEEGMTNEFMELIEIDLNKLSFDTLSVYFGEKAEGEDFD